MATFGAATDLAKSLPYWAQAEGENDAAKEIMRRGSRARKRLRELVEFYDHLADARRFLDDGNLRLIRQWVGTGNSPFSKLHIKRDEDALILDVEWFAARYDKEFHIHSGVDAPLPDREDINRLNIAEILH
ncbi:hypothetical protein [Rhizobium ruizarguesonis]|uniref:hypothetical protein n=1 Tax=Rhizobium ruizarguesonis TaxID=2081791 RepID=UPI001030A8C0|nr:hypothetical protein [Rhizobium ruizarguesonis]TAW02085.1 hypothetical protein ELI25_37625 [Rhizobium ruizarguesonis]TAZ47022.1 hypothetical protein ELH76_32485 [Rhizobium ruizarguesonis]